MITAIYLSYYFMLVFYLLYIACILTITIIAINSIRQTIKMLALDIAQIIQAFKSYEQDRIERRQLFEDDRQIARLQIQAGRRLMLDTENYTAVWQGRLQDVTKH